MVEFIALGVHDNTDQKESEGSEKNETKYVQKGLYLFDCSLKKGDGFLPHRKITDNVFTKSSPDLESLLQISQSPISTPRVVKNINDKLYLITRIHIIQLSYDGASKSHFSMQQSSIYDFIKNKNEEDKKLVRMIEDKDQLICSIDNVHNNMAYFSFFLSDTLKDEKSFQEITKGIPLGLVLSHTVGTTEADIVRTQFNPTGKLYIEGNTLQMVSKTNLLTYNLSDLKRQTNVLNGNIDEANIVDVSSVDGYTLFSTNKEGYILNMKSNTNNRTYISEKREDYSCISDSSRTGLPSSATSVLIYKKSNNGVDPTYYALFGLERGKIRVYEINNKSNELEFKKTIPFISAENNDVARERYILNLKQVSDFVCFTMGNLFIKIPFNNLLNFDESKRIERSQELSEHNKSLDNYLTSFKTCYSPDKLLHVPHKIASYDFWSVK